MNNELPYTFKPVMAQNKISLSEPYLELIRDETELGNKVTWYYDELIQTAVLGSNDIKSKYLSSVARFKIKDKRIKIASKLPDKIYEALINQEWVCIFPDYERTTPPILYVGNPERISSSTSNSQQDKNRKGSDPHSDSYYG